MHTLVTIYLVGIGLMTLIHTNIFFYTRKRFPDLHKELLWIAPGQIFLWPRCVIWWSIRHYYTKWRHPERIIY